MLFAVVPNMGDLCVGPDGNDGAGELHLALPPLQPATPKGLGADVCVASVGGNHDHLGERPFPVSALADVSRVCIHIRSAGSLHNGRLSMEMEGASHHSTERS